MRRSRSAVVKPVRDDPRLGRRCRWLLSEHDHDHDHDQASSGDDLDDTCTYDLDDEHLFHHDYNPANGQVLRAPQAS